MLIKVKTLTGKEIEIDIEPTDKVERIKERVEEKEGIPPQQQRLIFSGKQMNDEKTAQDYKTMDRVKVCELLCLLNANSPSEYAGDVLHLLSENIKNVQEKLPDVHVDLESNGNKKLTADQVGTYLAWTFHLLNELKTSLLASDDALNVLSVQQNKLVRDALHESITIGVRFNLQPKMPQRRTPPSTAYTTQHKSLTTDYDRLCYTTSQLVQLLPCAVLRPLVVFAGFQPLLNALYQLIYCPLKKPGGHLGNHSIGAEVYQQFLHDKENFKRSLHTCEKSMPRSIFVKETMLLLKTECSWLKKAVGQNLTAILKDNGLTLIVTALLEDSRDYDINDTTKSWKSIEVVTKLVVSLRRSVDFEVNICGQLVDLLAKGDGLYEVIFASCACALYPEDTELCRGRLLAIVFEPVQRFLLPSREELYKFEENEDITDSIIHTTRLLKLLFSNNHGVELPFEELTPYILYIFRLYSVVYTYNTEEVLEELSTNLADILSNYLQRALGSDQMLREDIFDSLLFGSSLPSNILKFRQDVCVVMSKNRLVVSEDITNFQDTSLQAKLVLKLVKKNEEMKFFLYLLNCLGKKEKFSLSQVEFTSLFLCNLLSTMIEEPGLQRRISEDPWEVLEYVASALEKYVARKVHLCAALERSIFLLVMILDVLVGTTTLRSSSNTSNTSKTPSTADYSTLVDRIIRILREIRDGCVSKELTSVVKSVIDVLTTSGNVGDLDSGVGADVATPSALDKAVADICDPLLPIRAHGLMLLTRLVEDQHPEVMEKKMFVLNIFQQNIKNQDSFIYLSAINGMALMAEMLPDTVLTTLTDEYIGGDLGAADAFEVRMKLGEVLVKVSRNLGDQLPKYKSLLLNAFMQGTKDDDHLLRASSLSNLGEVCQALGYKLGTIVNEVLACVRNVILTDPAVEARRAAVAVIRQLFVGLRAETAAFLNADLADICHTLRRIYAADDDAVLRLQAQLAIEELAANMPTCMRNNLQNIPQQPNLEEKESKSSK